MSVSPSDHRVRYVPALDGLRAVAVLGVMASHTTLGYFYGGGLGVDVFFVLSGYLITELLLQERERNGRISLPNFYARRALRLLPALVALVIVGDLYAHGLSHSPSAHYRGIAHATLTATVPVLLYFGNWLRALNGLNALGLFGHTWSLSIEEQFYIVWPALLIAALAVKRRLTPIVVVVVLFAASAAERIILWHGLASTARIYDGSDTRAVALLAGCALALLIDHSDEVRSMVRRTCAALAWPAAVAFAIIAYRPDPFYEQYGGTIEAVLAAIVIGYLVTRRRSAMQFLLSRRVLVGIGKISYGLYLWHYFIFNVIVEQRRYSVGKRTAIEFALTFIVAVISFFVIERPALKLKQRFRST